jgi:ribosomal protein S18 acetylase RimI-like enzyme
MSAAEHMIRRAEARDAADVARMLRDFNDEFGEPTPPIDELADRIAQLLAAREITVLLAGDGPAGFAQLQLRTSLYSTSPDAYLGELYVVPERRGAGLGRALLDAAIEAARHAGAGRMELNTSTDDTAAIGLYESTGFTNREGGPDGPRMLYYELEF